MKTLLHLMFRNVMDPDATASGYYDKDPCKTELYSMRSIFFRRSHWKTKEAAGGDADGKSLSMAARKRPNKRAHKLENPSIAKKGPGTKPQKSLVRAKKVSSITYSDPLEAIQNLNHLFIRHSRNRETC